LVSQWTTSGGTVFFDGESLGEGHAACPMVRFKRAPKSYTEKIFLYYALESNTNLILVIYFDKLLN
jgi:hypothetical protein